MPRLANISVSVVFLLTSLVQVASAGERLEFNVMRSGVKERITLYLQGPQARIISSADARTAVIFDADSRQIHIVDHTNRSVTTLDQASMERMASMARDVGKFAQSQGGVLGDLFKTFGLDNSMGEQAEISVKSIDKIRSFAGINCRIQQVYEAKKLQTQLCLADKISIAATERQTLDSLLMFGQLMIREGQMIMSQFNLPIPLLPEASLAGVPIYIDNLAGQTRASLASLKSMDIQAAQFALPAGYKKTTLSL